MKKIASILGFLAVMGLAFTSAASPVMPFSDTIVLSPEDRFTRAFLLNRLETTQVLVNGDGDGDVDCFLYDENGNVVAADNSVEDRCYLRVVPKWRGVFILRIINNGTGVTLADVVIR
jgi:hypothetical protein